MKNSALLRNAERVVSERQTGKPNYAYNFLFNCISPISTNKAANANLLAHKIQVIQLLPELKYRYST